MKFLMEIYVMRLTWRLLGLIFLLSNILRMGSSHPNDNQPLSKIAVHKASIAIQSSAYVEASPSLLGEKPVLLAISNTISFLNPKAPVYPRLSQGKLWNEMTVTWTSGYNIDEAIPVVKWGPEEQEEMAFLSPAGTLTFSRNSMCGSPARTVGWRDPGFIHTSFLKDLWPNTKYRYKVGHRLLNGSYVWGPVYVFQASPYPGQDSLQRVIIFGDLGKAERDGSNEYSNYQPGSLNTTDRLVEDLDNINIVLHIGDLSYANGYLSEWDQFTSQIEPIASRVPYMVASGNHERDWPNTGSFYKNMDSGGECGVLAETMFYVPAKDRAKF